MANSFVGSDLRLDLGLDVKDLRLDLKDLRLALAWEVETWR